MAKKFICGGKRYEIGGQTRDSIGLPVSIKSLPEKIEAEGYTLLRKTSFHVSLVCVGQIVKKHALAIPEFVNNIIADFCEFTKSNSVDFLRYRDEFRFVSHNERRSVVVMCDVSSLDKFFKFMNERYKLNVEYPPTHITLWTLQPDAGIFITDSSDIKQLTKLIENPGIVL